MKLKLNKPFLSFFLSLTIILGTSFFCNASDINTLTNDMNTTYSEKEITNLDILYDMAKNNISDELESNSEKILVQDNKTKHKVEYDTISTTQLVEIKEKDGLEVKSYVKTTFLDENYLNTPNTNSISTFGSGSQNDDKWDNSSGVHAYSTIKYQTLTGDGVFKYYKLTTVSGKWVISDSSIKLSSRSVKLSQIGIVSGSASLANQTTTKYPTSNTFSYSAPSSWKAVGKDSLMFTIGVLTKVTLKRGTSSSWTLTLDNHI